MVLVVCGVHSTCAVCALGYVAWGVVRCLLSTMCRPKRCCVSPDAICVLVFKVQFCIDLSSGSRVRVVQTWRVLSRRRVSVCVPEDCANLIIIIRLEGRHGLEECGDR